MKCPHCLVEMSVKKDTIHIGKDGKGDWAIKTFLCPNPSCNNLIVYLLNGKVVYQAGGTFKITEVKSNLLVYPKGTSRSPPPPEVPEKFADDYKEACLVLPDSPKASSALSRRCLQHILRDVAKVNPGNLADEIQQVLDKNLFPSYIADPIDAIRNIGNFAAHPIKSTSTGEIIPVEPGEAEWNLDVLELLFDFYFVQPARIKKKKDELNKKLKDAGKHPMK